MTAPRMNLTMLLHGISKSGKTHFTAGAPRPVFISPVSERGWLGLGDHPNWENITICGIPQLAGFREIGGAALAEDKLEGAPTANALASIERVVTKIARDHVKRGWQTVVIDTATMLMDVCVQGATDFGARKMITRGDDNDWTQIYNMWDFMRATLQGLPLNLIWTFHSSIEERGIWEPTMTGKYLRKKIMPSCAVDLYIEKRSLPVDAQGNPVADMSLAVAQKAARYLWSQCPYNYPAPGFYAGSRFEASLPVYCAADWDTFAAPLRERFAV